MKPEPHAQFTEPMIVYRKAKRGHGAHHGGAWKIAYADFVTAMMAFFMLLWIIGATNEDQRKGIADYFTPTVIQMKNSGGSNGIGGGRSLQVQDGVAPHATITGRRPMPIQGGSTGSPLESSAKGRNTSTETRGQGAASATAGLPVAVGVLTPARTADAARFAEVEKRVAARLAGDPALKGLRGQIRFVRTHDGLRIDLVERADFSMFGLATSSFTDPAAALVRTVAAAVADTPNALTIRGHTDARAYNRGDVNNWTLSTGRADATRRALTEAGVASKRFRRIEGVADTDPYNAADGDDPRNRRISVTLMYEDSAKLPR